MSIADYYANAFRSIPVVEWGRFVDPDFLEAWFERVDSCPFITGVDPLDRCSCDPSFVWHFRDGSRLTLANRRQACFMADAFAWED